MREPVTVVLTGDEVTSALGHVVAARVNWPCGPAKVTLRMTTNADTLVEARVTLSDPA